MKIFIVADNPEERDLYQLILRHAGLEVVTRTNLKQVLDNWSNDWANLIVLAVDNKATIVKKISQMREVTQMPVIVIVNPPTETDLCNVLQAGADLVLPRPVSARVLTGYTRVLLRRSGSVPVFVLPTVEHNQVKLDPATRTVAVGNQKPRRLTHLEFNLLYLLMVNQGQVIPVDVIVERVWGYSGKGDRELVRGLVSRLRHKLEPGGKQSRLIKNVPGVGYCFGLNST